MIILGSSRRYVAQDDDEFDPPELPVNSDDMKESEKSDDDSSELEVIEEIPRAKSKIIKNPFFDRNPSWKDIGKLTKYKCAVTLKCQQCRKCGYRLAGSKSTTAKHYLTKHCFCPKK